MITTINIVVMYTNRSLLRTEMDYTVKLDFGDDPVRSVDEKLEILKFDYSWADAMEEEDRKNEEEKRMEILCDFKLCDKDNEAGKREMENKRRLDVMRAIQAELLAKFKQRDGKRFKEAITKIENENDKRQKLAHDAWKTEKRESLLNQILVDLVRKIRKRRNPQMARKIMTELEEHRRKLLKLQEELIKKCVEKEKFRSMKKIYQDELLAKIKEKQKLCLLKKACQQELTRRFKEKEEIRQMKEAFQRDLIRRIKEKEKIRQMKIAYQQELMRRLKEKEEMRQTKEAFLLELMVYHRKKQEDSECFVPRKLFLFNIDTFSCPPMPNCVQQNENKEKAFKSEEERSAPPLTKSIQKKPRQSLKRRMKTWFGGK